ncbi:MAG: hypothetical protein J3T61_03225 [Candidatus Brocadiales bacterium]|nr:hypothetical protein [Candidatus Bathyanammoxibius sp.]
MNERLRAEAQLTIDLMIQLADVMEKRDGGPTPESAKLREQAQILKEALEEE